MRGMSSSARRAGTALIGAVLLVAATGGAGGAVGFFVRLLVFFWNAELLDRCVKFRRMCQEEVTFEKFSDAQLSGATREQVVKQLTESGLWTSLKTRPFSKVADPATEPRSIFVNAMDTNPLAPSMSVILNPGLCRVLKENTHSRYFSTPNFCKMLSNGSSNETTTMGSL